MDLIIPADSGDIELWSSKRLSSGDNDDFSDVEFGHGFNQPFGSGTRACLDRGYAGGPFPRGGRNPAIHRHRNL